MINPITNSTIALGSILLADEEDCDPIVVVDDLPGPANNQAANTNSWSKCFFANRNRIVLGAKVTWALSFTVTLVSSFGVISPNQEIRKIAQICGISFFLLTTISGFGYFISKLD